MTNSPSSLPPDAARTAEAERLAAWAQQRADEQRFLADDIHPQGAGAAALRRVFDDNAAHFAAIAIALRASPVSAPGGGITAEVQAVTIPTFHYIKVPDEWPVGAEVTAYVEPAHRPLEYSPGGEADSRRQQELQKAARLALEVLEDQKTESQHCGDRDYECPMQDIFKSWHGHQIARDALRAALNPSAATEEQANG